MCSLCDEGKPQYHSGSRRNFLKGAAATGFVAATGLPLFAVRPARAGFEEAPQDSGRPGRRYVIRGGSVMSMDPQVGDFAEADVLVEGKKILAVGPNLNAGGAVIDATGHVVMPGFIDTHHHQFETALRSFLADGILLPDGTPTGVINYYQYILQTFAPVYRPQDVYINELFGSLSQLDDGVTTVHDISQIHHSPAHSDAVIQALIDSGRRAAFGYFESAGGVAGNQYPTDAIRINKQWFSSTDQLVTMIMGGEVYLPGYEKAWLIGRQLDLQVAAHILSPFGIRPTLDLLAQGKGGDSGTLGLGPDNLFVHMTGMSDMAWQKVKDASVQVSLAVPIEMNMRHGMPPILKMQSLAMEPSLSVDVECTLTADFFTQMRSCMNLQRALVNQMILDSASSDFPTPPPETPTPLTTRDVLRYGTLNGAKALRLDDKVGSLTPGKEADIILLDTTRINVAPLNQVPGAVVSLMDRTNVETVIVAGKVRKWKGQLLDVDLPRLRNQLEASRDYIFSAAGIPQDLFRSN
ncbi:MAG: amidohydrolase [Rhodospirillales bacterium]|nr:amidohydrolase [Rhodospirillales bacterium]